MTTYDPKSGRKGQKPENAAESAVEGVTGERIAKRIARAGICSRRDAERLIEAGEVTVNGKKIDSPALNVTDADLITVEARPAASGATKLWRYHKPAGSSQRRKTLKAHHRFERLPPEMPRVVSVGRLDINTKACCCSPMTVSWRGFLSFPHRLDTPLPRARLGQVTQKDLDKLKDGIEVEGVRYGPSKLTRQSAGLERLADRRPQRGKNREVKRVLAALDLTVNRLIRLSFGPFQVGDLARAKSHRCRTAC